MRARLNAALVVGIAAVIAVLSLMEQPTGGIAPSTFALPGHFILYFLLAGSLLLHFHDTRRGHIEAFAVAVLFGVLMELAQYPLPYRHFALQDAMVNALGAGFIFLDHRSRVVTRIIQTEDRLIEEYLLERG